MGKGIPDRWLNYRPIGDRIAGTRFIAFKVPLSKNINESVDDEQLRLAPQSLLESVPNLGLIVDLTNTNRYYSPQTFKDKNVEHQKLMIPGHVTPAKALSQRFCQYVSDFLNANPDNDKLIGVHCTHGVNRTGYLICYFMITQMNMSPQQAIQNFAEARGHKIERMNYMQSLEHLKPARQKTLSLESDRPGGDLKPRKAEEPPTNWRSRSEAWHQEQQPQQWRWPGHREQYAHPQPQQQRRPGGANLNTYQAKQDVSQHERNPGWRPPSNWNDEAPWMDSGRQRNESNWQPRRAIHQSYNSRNSYHNNGDHRRNFSNSRSSGNSDGRSQGYRFRWNASRQSNYREEEGRGSRNRFQTLGRDLS